MSQSCDKIEHSGVVVSIDGDCADVRILRTSACTSCNVSRICNKTESREMNVKVRGMRVSDFKEGDNVVVTIKASMARMAVVYGFGFPLLIMLLSFIITKTFCKDDLITSVVSLGMVAVYYVILYLLRDRLDKKFLFEITDIKKI